MSFKLNHIWIVIWIIVFVMGLKIDCRELLCNNGMDIIQGEYYRFFSGLLVHVNLIHLIINIISLYFIVNILHREIKPIKLLLFSVVVGIVSNSLFSLIYRNSTSVGGSPIILAMLGLLVSLYVMHKNVERFTLKTIQTRWILGYAILSNIPIFSGNISTFIIHVISFLIAFLWGCIGVWINYIKLGRGK